MRSQRCVLLIGSLLVMADATASALTPPAQSHVLRFGGSHWLHAPGSTDLAVTGALTIELWARPEKLVEYSDVVLFSDPSMWLAGLELPGNGKWMFFTPSGNVEASVVQVLNRWTHVAARASASKLDLFIDGTLVGTTAITSPVHLATVNLDIGQSYFGALRQVRLWRAALSDAEIRVVAEQPPDENDARLLAWWPMDDGASNPLSTMTVADRSPGALDLPRQFPTSSTRWARPSILEGGPYFEAVLYSVNGLHPVLIDFDHDQDLDIYTVENLSAPQVEPPHYSGPPPEPDRSFRNDGSGRFTEVSDQVLEGPRIQAYLVGSMFAEDFTGDGLDDVLITDAGPEVGVFWGWPESLRAGNAGGDLVNESSSRMEQRNDYSHRAAIGDIDSDGDLDVAVAGALDMTKSGTSEQRYVFFHVNDGTGRFGADGNRTPLGPARSEFATSVALLDTDLDGDLDLYWGEIGNFPVDRLLENDGTGNFLLTPASWQPAKHRFPGECVEWDHPCRQSNTIMPPVDINRDGVLDLLIGVLDVTYQDVPADGIIRPFLHVLLGNGDGTLRDGSSLMPPVWNYEFDGELNPAQLYSFRAFDQNGDLWPDLATNEFTSVSATILMNRGSEGFEEVGDLIPPALNLSHMAVGDVDRDGDADLTWGPVVLRNLKPYAPNQYPAADLSLDLRLSGRNALVQISKCTNNSAASATNLTMAVPVPHGYTWSSTNGGGGECSLQEHVVVCTLASLAAGATWPVLISSRQTGTVDPQTTFAVASVTGDVIDADLTNNVERVRLDEASLPSRRRAVRH